MSLYNNGGGSWYVPGSYMASAIIFRNDDFPDVHNVDTALTFLMSELKNIVIQGGSGVDDNNISLLTTWSSSKINDIFVQKVTGKDLSTNDFTDAYKAQLDGMVNYLADINYLKGLAHNHANKSTLDLITPAKVTEWDNKSNFSGDYNDLINKPDLSNLTLYATKDWVQLYHQNNTYATLSLYPDYGDLVREDELDLLNTNLTYAKKQWVLDQIASKDDFSMIKVTSLPTEATEGAGNIDTNKIYLLQISVNPELYEKYINLDGTDQGWELLSNTLIDLSNYYNKAEINQFRTIDTQAQSINVADTSNILSATNVEDALKELKVGLDNIDVTKYAEKDNLADIAFSGKYEDIVDKPIEVLLGETVTPVVWSEVPAGIYFAKGAQKVLSQSAETPEIICYGTTEVYHYNDGNGNRVTTAFTSKLVGGQFKPCTVIMTYPDTLIGTPTVEYYYYPNTNEVLVKDNNTPYTPLDDYNPATKLYVDQAIANKDLSNYLAKDNTTTYIPTDTYNPATKGYVDDNIPTLVSQLTNDSDYLLRSKLNDEVDYLGYIKREIVTVLPDPINAQSNIIYMILNANDEYDKYIYTGSNNGNNGFEQLGSGGGDIDENDIKKLLFELQADGKTPDETLPLYLPVDDVTIHDKPEVLTWINATQEQIDSYLDIINDTSIETLKVWSSAKANAEMINVLDESKAYTDVQMGLVNRPQYEHVDSLDQMVQTDRFYLLENPVGSGKFDMYIVNGSDGTKSKIGNTDVNLDACQKIVDNTLTTTDKTVPGAINEHDSEIGNLDDLQTIAKYSLVDAINEHNVIIGDKTTLTTTTQANLVDAINELDSDIDEINSNIGDKTTLTTTNQTDLVSAINEHDSEIGNLDDLVTSVKTDLVSAINDIKANLIADVKMDILKATYPVDSLYINTSDTNPADIFGFGTWERVASNMTLWGASANGQVKTTKSAGLPNINGQLVHYMIAHNLWGAEKAFTGSDYQKQTWGRTYDSSNSDTMASKLIINFDASKSNSIYGNSSTVQPPAYVVNIWRRTA